MPPSSDFDEYIASNPGSVLSFEMNESIQAALESGKTLYQAVREEWELQQQGQGQEPPQEPE